MYESAATLLLGLAREDFSLKFDRVPCWSNELVSVVVALHGKPGKKLVDIFFGFCAHLEEDRDFELFGKVLTILKTHGMLCILVFFSTGKSYQDI